MTTAAGSPPPVRFPRLSSLYCIAIGVLVIGCLVASCRSTAPPGYQHIKLDTNALINASALGAGDVFELRVHGHADLSGVHRVSPGGAIDVPLIGRVKVDGLTSSQIADAVNARLKNGYLNNPYVTVYVKEFNSKKVFVLGQVKKPGIFTFDKNMNIVQAIALAGGFTELAEKNYAIVTRVDKGVERRIPVPVEKIITDHRSKNFVLQPGDIVFVPEAVL